MISSVPSPPEELRAVLGAEVRETHISWVLLAADRGYKLKKPITLPFLDYGTLERRRALCHDEVRLNRRLAPDVYIGVRAVVVDDGTVRLAPEDAPGAVEYAVEMRRYDEGATLSRRLAEGTAREDDLRAVGRRLAAFHAEAAIPSEPERTVAGLEAMLEENFATLRTLVPEPAGAIDEAAALAAAVLDGRRAELLARARSGRVREGHGDLRAEHVVLERGIEIVDCVEFDPALREQDAGLDLAFLVMDVARRDEHLSRVLVEAYREAGGDPGDDSLVAFFAAQRALIRAKVALIRAGQVEGTDADRRRADAAALLALAARLGWRVRLGEVAIVCGGSATGKSTLAEALAARAGATVVSTDVVRKDLLGLRPTARAPLAAYGAEVNRRTYSGLGRRVAELRAAGERVIVDGTFRFAADRAAFACAAGGAGSVALWIECRARAAVVARRAAKRIGDPERVSDADATVAARQAAQWEPLTDVAAGRHVVVATDRPPDAVVAALRAALDRLLRAG